MTTLPYARDEASTSHHHANNHLSYSQAALDEHAVAEWANNGQLVDELRDNEEELQVQDGAALQYWAAKRHKGEKKKDKADEEYVGWRLKSRMKTFNAGMFICLNIGVDPPDVVKTNPCAKLECWLDPTALPSTKAIEAIGRNLQQQFETLNPKVKYKSHLDPSIEETKKQCVNMRKVARDERVVFYYNGHGVPKPTHSGEIWVFNKNYTQYIPVSLYDLQEWLGSPCIYVWECSGAGNILNNFGKQAEKKDNEARSAAVNQTQNSTPSRPASDLPGTSFADAIHLAACTASQVLPMSPDLPADLFTCCLTSPIETSLRHFVLQDPLKRNISTSKEDPRSRITVDMVMRIPGDLKDRRTPLGELNWIFTAVTDTIAWSSFPREVFNRLFRQDLLVAALFRNFLLAQRIMTSYHCTPMSIPELPSTHNHPLWHSWDLAVDECLAQLPDLLDLEVAREKGQITISPLSTYRPSTFFAQHLQAFEVWLQHGSSLPNHLSHANNKKGLTHRPPPEQLPIVLQVLLSQAHRLRALILLSRFVDLGPWAVHLSLSIGIFPYVQKLLQSPAVELKPVLIFIWARILAVDKSCQVDLLRDAGYNYFAQILSPYPSTGVPLVIPNANEHRAMCAFILSILCRNFRPGQAACLSINVFDACLARLHEDDWLLKTWSLLCVAQIWADNDDAKALFMQQSPKQTHQQDLLSQLKSSAVEVRAAALYAFGTLLGASSAPIDSPDIKGGGGTGAQVGVEETAQLEIEAGLAFACMMSVKEDASPLVRKELVVVISCVVREWRGWLVCAAWAYFEQEALAVALDQGVEDSPDLVGKALEEWVRSGDKKVMEHQHNLTLLSSFKVLFETLLDLSVDPNTEVALMASTVVDYVVALLLDSAFSRVRGSAVQKIVSRHRKQRPALGPRAMSAAPGMSGRLTPQPNGTRPNLIRADTDTSNPGSASSTLKRNSSVANALRSLASMTGLVSSESPKSDTWTPESSPEVSVAPPTPSSTSYKSPYPDASHERITPDSNLHLTRAGSVSAISRARTAMTLSMSGIDGHNDPVSPASVLNALTEEDMERLRRRRAHGSQAGGDADGKLNNNGLARHDDLGLGTVAKEVKDDVLPLRSGFFDWAMEYFKEPQMKVPDADEPGSTTYNQQAWRHIRNESALERGRSSEEYAAQHSWESEAGIIHNDSWPLQVAFHSYDPVMAVTDDADGICLWDWQTRTRINKFSNTNVTGSCISSLHFINEMASSLMLTASTEGSVRIWRDYDTPGETQLASSFRAISETFPVGQSSGVLTAWQQHHGHLLVGGDMKVVRLWDATVERHLRDMPTQAGSNLTAIASDEPDGNVYVTGFGDGVVRLFDKRMERADQVVIHTWRKHHTWIQSVHVQRGGLKELVTGSMNGEVRIWDVRFPDAPLYEHVAQPTGLMALAVHPGASVFATTSAPTSQSYRQKLVIEGFPDPAKPKILSKLSIPSSPAYHIGNRSPGFMPSASSLVFHPVEDIIAVAGFEASGNIRMLKCPIPSGVLADHTTSNGF
ncbi:raptor N-terminal caspase like domain-domain-containing protein [Kockovaella imperatae]|uniref:Raptor N-terminal caspase like domain-domain-containing protein n=1 Tax=Kockovaella imperatae TaxID=4999 RepID=A0A1Y1URT0_9TREE|nr:raptor N-terminal caspase like domain-domain-containing protein [Kockovaella imperatae]ORX40214.1 raptor N-terminal caspase like domain-domain-containing protein [Kockovaella imperatae]